MSEQQTEEQNESVVELKKPGTEETVKVSTEIKDLISEMVSIARKDAKTKAEKQFQPMRELLTKLETENSQISEEMTKIKESQMSDSEKLQSQYERNVKSLQEKYESVSKVADNWKSKYEQHKIMTDIYSAFGEYKLVNSEHAAILFMQSCKPELQQKIDAAGKGLDEYETRVRLMMPDASGGAKEIEGTPREVFKHWISLDSNKHLIANSLNPGSGSSPNGKIEPTSDIDKMWNKYEEAMKTGDVKTAIIIKEQIRQAKQRLA